GMVQRQLSARDVLAAMNRIGYSSLFVICVTGAFIGMVLAVQAYSQFHQIGLDTSLGAVIHKSVLRELGPVLTAVMLAGRVGSAMAAEIGTMRVTEQIDALTCLGVQPVRHLVSPRLLASLLMIPLLTAIADVMGILGSNLICLRLFQIDSHHYWEHTLQYVGVWDMAVGVAKSVVFAAVVCLIACQQGFRSRAGAEGVGQAATLAFVYSFMTILVVDFFMGILTNALYTIFHSIDGVKTA
ncbi:MAG: MlaE family ABC transporter permease, partial [Gemmataceae bacterium]